MIARYIIEVIPATLSEKTQETELQHIKKIKMAFGDWLPSDVTTKHIYQYLDSRTAKVSANREVRVLKKVFDYGIKWGVIEFNPCRHVKLHAEKPRQREVTLKEFARIKRMASPKIAQVMDFAFITAARPGEIFALKKSSVTNEGILLKDFKTNQEFIIDISRKMKMILAKCNGKSEALFENESGNFYTVSGFRSCFKRVVQKAIDKGLIEDAFTLRDVRAMAITFVANRHGLEQARNLAGHKTSATTGRVYYRGVKARRSAR
jgi:integrase